ncbi:SSI family serine proteinase inhibitor [Streptomyces sp. NPDC050732]|uniref:SSI family serine proteinase inhibitor n=1 Tax=Streptomyces sp. NPDC050732 TaxID=3154632 RepID=UPI0034375600
MLRRLALTAAASAAALSALPALPAAAHASTLPTTPIDRLTVTVTGMGGEGDGTYRLNCHPAGGTHPQAKEACARLDEISVYGKDLFAPVPPGTMCTMQYGGPATARITGTWHGRPVNATYDRSNGCEIGRWNTLVPVLPAASA